MTRTVIDCREVLKRLRVGGIRRRVRLSLKERIAAVRRAHAGVSIEALACEYRVTIQTVKSWVDDYARQCGAWYKCGPELLEPERAFTVINGGAA